MFRGFLEGASLTKNSPTIWGGSSHPTVQDVPPQSPPALGYLGQHPNRKISERKKQIIYLQWCIKYVSTFQHQSLKLPSPTTPAIIISAPGFFVSKKLLQLFNLSAFFFEKIGCLSRDPLGRKKQRKPVRSSRLSFPSGHRSFERSAGRWPSFGRAGPRGKKKWTVDGEKSEWQESCVLCVCNIY